MAGYIFFQKNNRQQWPIGHLGKNNAIKLLNDLCLECSICAIFFNSSFTVSINARFRNRILSSTLINEFLMLFFTLCQQLYSIQEQVFEQGLTDIPFVRTKFSL